MGRDLVTRDQAPVRAIVQWVQAVRVARGDLVVLVASSLAMAIPRLSLRRKMAICNSSVDWITSKGDNDLIRCRLCLYCPSQAIVRQLGL